jgi:hypothetical protein
LDSKAIGGRTMGWLHWTDTSSGGVNDLDREVWNLVDREHAQRTRYLQVSISYRPTEIHPDQYIFSIDMAGIVHVFIRYLSNCFKKIRTSLDDPPRSAHQSGLLHFIMYPVLQWMPATPPRSGRQASSTSSDAQ